MLYGSDHNGEIHTYHIYPLVIIVDRYNGCYSGGKFTVWNSYPEDIPEDIYSDDDTCYYFSENHTVVFYNLMTFNGRGSCH